MKCPDCNQPMTVAHENYGYAASGLPYVTLVGVHPFGGFNMSGTDSKAGGRDYLLLFLQGKSIAEKVTR